MQFKVSKHWQYVLIGIVVLIVIIALWPLPSSILNPESQLPVRVVDRNGALLYEQRQSEHGTQEWVNVQDIPPQIISALVSIEDRNFFAHWGVSVRGTLRAAWQNVTTGRVISGGSTITQQLVRIGLQPKKRSVLYKIREAILALKVDAKLSKEEILEQYLNRAYFGHQAYGILAASRTFFGKSPAELSLAEASLLVGLLQSPSALDPFQNMEKALARRERVLTAMKETSVITQEEAAQVAGTPVRLSPDRVNMQAPHFVFWALEAAGDQVPGSTIATTLDLPLQQTLEGIVERNVAALAEKNVTSAAVVVLDATNGDILSMIGSADYFHTEHDGAVNVAISPRQPGSTMKPFTYALALSAGDTAATTVADIETQFFTQEGNPYVPRNYDYGYHGLVRYREALANSYNIAAVKVLERVGVANLLGFLRQLGISNLTQSPDHYGLALTLGDAEISLLELARAYAVFPRQGTILHTRELLNQPVVEGEHVLDAKVAWLISDILSDNEARLPEFRDDGPLTFAVPVAAKTGTTRNSRDNWVIGYTADRVVGVWVGNADNTPMKGTSGVTGAGPIFREVMLEVLKTTPARPFARPAGMVEKDICVPSGKLPTPECPHTMREVFIAGTEPTQQDDIYQSISIDTRNDLLAGSGCPPEFMKIVVFPVFPPNLRKWAEENRWNLPPVQYSPFCPGSEAVSDIEIVRPHNGDSFRMDPLIPDSSELIRLEAASVNMYTAVQWLVDGEWIGTGIAPHYTLDWQLQEGTHTIEVRVGKKTDSVRIEVIR